MNFKEDTFMKMSEDKQIEYALKMSDWIKECCENIDLDYFCDGRIDYINLRRFVMSSEYGKWFKEGKKVVSFSMLEPSRINYSFDVRCDDKRNTYTDLYEIYKNLVYYETMDHEDEFMY